MLVACEQSPNTESEARVKSGFDLQAEEEAVHATLDEIVTAWNSGNVEGFLAAFTDDMVIDPPNGPAISGKEANRSVYLSRFENSTYDVSIEVQELIVAGDWAFDRSVFAGTSTNKQTGRSST
jgi:uncharacterized protein (TIGR02246 family)